MSSTNWMLTDKMVDEFLQALKLEHLRFMDKAGNEKPTINSETVIDYDTFCTAYEKMDKGFQSKCPKTVFAFSNNGFMQTRYDDLEENLTRLVYTFKDYHELCYCSGKFSEQLDFSMFLKLVEQNYLEKHCERQNMPKREFKNWVEFVTDHAQFLLNPFNQKEIFVSKVIESDILVQLRTLDIVPWLCYNTLKDFQKRFEDATNQSKYSRGTDVLFREDFYDLNILDDKEEQPFTHKFVERLFDTLASKQKLKKVTEYRMNFRTFVQIRRMLFYPKSVATRHFLFELIDLNGDGFIGVDEVRYFYNGLSRMYTKAGLDEEYPFVSFKDFFASWYDQMAPFDNDCQEKKLSFEQIKNHAYGHECLMMLINYRSYVDFDQRFELGYDHDPAADTILGEEVQILNGENDENSNGTSDRKQNLDISV